jgi:putative DNA primase/helicase
MSAEIERKRREWARAGAEGEVEADADDSVLSGNNSARQVEAGAAPREADFGGLPPHKNVGESDRQVAENSAVAESPGRETEISILDAALWWAARGVPVFPLYSVFDGICFCPEGSECKSAGKHPLTRRGLKEATTDATQIRRWWGSHPHANVGGRTGGALCLVVVDVDPKSGGDASLCDLSDAHGMDWLDTFSAETGSRGTHLFFTYSEGVELRNTAGKLAPGIDTRAEGGYVVLAPSLHASGRRYWLSNKTDIAAAPAWLVESLTRKPGDLPPVAIDFQERRARRGGGPVIGEGERNERLFRIGCARWGKGEAKDRGDLYSQLLAVNVERVSPPLTPSEVVKIVDSITARYARGAPIKEAGT